MVTETAAEVAGLCLAPVQSLGSIEQLLIVLKKKKKISLREKYSLHHFHWDS